MTIEGSRVVTAGNAPSPGDNENREATVDAIGNVENVGT